jgi:hypothetical protein
VLDRIDEDVINMAGEVDGSLAAAYGKQW